MDIGEKDDRSLCYWESCQNKTNEPPCLTNIDEIKTKNTGDRINIGSFVLGILKCSWKLIVTTVEKCIVVFVIN